MNLVGKSSNKKRARRAFVAALTSSFLLVLPSCGIPQLRCPQPGAVLPNIYNHGNGWNNLGAVWGNGAVSPSRARQVTTTKRLTLVTIQQSPTTKQRTRKITKKAHLVLPVSSNPPARSTWMMPTKPAALLTNSMMDLPPPAATPHDGTSGPAGNNPTSTDNVIGSGNGAFGAGNSVISTDNSAQVAWNSFFDDPCLTSLIGQAAQRQSGTVDSD
ncbi:MAG: hypothetical protein R3C56_38465 [Pirellulaceae bacterium]